MRKTTMVLMGIALIAAARVPNWAGGKFILNNKGYLS